MICVICIISIINFSLLKVAKITFAIMLFLRMPYSIYSVISDYFQFYHYKNGC